MQCICDRANGASRGFNRSFEAASRDLMSIVDSDIELHHMMRATLPTILRRVIELDLVLYGMAQLRS